MFSTILLHLLVCISVKVRLHSISLLEKECRCFISEEMGLCEVNALLEVKHGLCTCQQALSSLYSNSLGQVNCACTRQGPVECILPLSFDEPLTVNMLAIYFVIKYTNQCFRLADGLTQLCEHHSNRYPLILTLEQLLLLQFSASISGE